MDIREFLDTVITAEEGWFCLALGVPNSTGWFEEWFKWPEEKEKIVARAQERRQEQNVYFSTYLFSKAQSTKDNVLPTRTIQADLDDADIVRLPVQPNVLVETSPDRHQGYWILSEGVELAEHEVLSRKLTYAIDGCDKSGWPLGRKVRLPETINHKYLDGPKNVRIVRTLTALHNASELELLPDVSQVVLDHFDEDFINNPPTLEIGPQELLNSTKIPAKLKAGYNIAQADRSAYLWALELAAFRQGLSKKEVFWLAKHSANNKFSLRYNADRELAKHVLSAEQAVRSNIQNERDVINQARKLPGISVHERRVQILALVRRFMEDQGKFFHTPDDDLYYIRNDVGRPIYISPRSDYFSSLLYMQFGLNQVESEFQYVVHGIMNYARSLPISGEIGFMSRFDMDSKTLLIHTGRKDVYIVTANKVVKGTDGAFDIIFPWMSNNDPFVYTQSDDKWYETMFGDCLDNVMGLTRAQAMAILRTWVLFALMRDASSARPILALLGQPGSGKTTIFKRVYRLFYGKHRSIVALTNMNDFDHAVTTDPVVVFDNLDTWYPWLPDRLAMSAQVSDYPKKRLYTDKDVVILKRHAMVAISAHNPKFGREDVADRLLILNFHRLPYWKAEGELLDNLSNKRSQMWGGIIDDVQAVLSTPVPLESEAPQFRIEDFARLGHWMARALGYEEDFVSAIVSMRKEQRSFLLEEDQPLTSALDVFLDKRNGTDNDRFYSVSQLWTSLSAYAPDQETFKKKYKNVIFLGKKLWALQEALSQSYEVEWQFNTKTSQKQWSFKKK